MPEVTGIENRWAAFGSVPTIVDQKFTDGRTYALDALNTANITIGNLRDIASTLNLIDTTTSIAYITPPVAREITSVIPGSPDIVITLPTAPSDIDDIQNVIRNKLINDIAMGTPAIPIAVETAMFQRETERAVLVRQDTIDNISAEWAKHGFTLSNGFLASKITQSEIDYRNKRLDISRDIAIKNFELSDTNTKFAIQQGLAYVANKVAIYKIGVDAEISRIETILKKYLGEAEVYKVSVQAVAALADIDVKIFDSTLRQELMKAELLIKNVEIEIKNFEIEYGLKVEATKAIGSINAQVVAGAFSSMNASVHLSASDSGSYTYSTNPSY
jgi:hypothetical protein